MRGLPGRVGRRLGLYARLLSPPVLARMATQAKQRGFVDALLARLPSAPTSQFRCVLVDAMYDNPNQWIRYALLRAALGLDKAREIGVLGPYRIRQCRRTLRRLGVSATVSITGLTGSRSSHRTEATRLLARTRAADDILHWRLPGDFPPDFVYDGVLKRQRSATVDLADPRLHSYVTEALACIEASRRLLDAYPFDIVVLSHAVNFQFASLAWLATRRGIPVLLSQGFYGVPRYTWLHQPSDLYDTMDRPSRAELDALPAERAEHFAGVGRRYLDLRHSGGTDDIGARYAFQRAIECPTRTTLVNHFSWDSDKPIIAVYAPNWFDFPHPCGMSEYRDFLDWIRVTLDSAVANRRVNWLFKAHPCDAWYGGVTLSDLLPPLEAHPHIRLVPSEWNGAAVLRAVDGVVTVHGTAGLEYAAAGKAVLVADRGWYHDTGFVRWARSRGEYVDALASDWWKDLDLEATARRAQIFAGWYFGRPAWQDGFVLEDDPRQAAIYETAPRLLSAHPEALARELETIRAWVSTGHRHYHTYKMSQADYVAC